MDITVLAVIAKTPISCVEHEKLYLKVLKCIMLFCQNISKFDYYSTLSTSKSSVSAGESEYFDDYYDLRKN